MLRKYLSLSPQALVVCGLILFLIFELLTIYFRFGLAMTSTEETAFLAPFTFGWRIHHGYIGFVMLLWSITTHWKLNKNYIFRERRVYIPKFQFFFNTISILGIGLFLSDIVHHFLVLWPITGSPNFDLMYK